MPRTELLLHLLLSITRRATAQAAVPGKRRVMIVLLPRVELVLVLLDRLPDAKHTETTRRLLPNHDVMMGPRCLLVYGLWWCGVVWLQRWWDDRRSLQRVATAGMACHSFQLLPNARDTYAALGRAIGELEWVRTDAIAFSGQLARVQEGVSRCLTELRIIARDDEEREVVYETVFWGEGVRMGCFLITTGYSQDA